MPVLILPLFNKFDPIDDVDLERRIKTLAASEGISVSRVLRMDMSKQTRKANAFFTGLGRTRRIVVADTLLDAFSADEVEVVLAHELGHQVHRDIWKLIALQVPMTLGSFFVMHRAAPALVARFGKGWKLEADRGLSDPAAFPVLALVGAGCGLLIAPIVNAVVRSRVERPADLYALRLTHNPGAFKSAMKKLGRMNLADPNPPRLIKWLFHDHPTLDERIELARGYEVGQ
jgi:STE24 endopeptidase